VPSLEVLTNDVQCKHGTAVGQLDVQHLLYMQSRGIGIKEAKKILIHGFFSNIVASLDETVVLEIYNRIERQTMV
jgi:Fe-S cluster assembly protein SufD